MSTLQPSDTQYTLMDLDSITQEATKKYHEIESKLDTPGKLSFIVNHVLAPPSKVQIITANKLCAAPRARQETAPLGYMVYTNIDDEPTEPPSDWKEFRERASNVIHDCDMVTKYGSTDTVAFDGNTFRIDYSNHPSRVHLPDHRSTSNYFEYLSEIPGVVHEDFGHLGFTHPFLHRTSRMITESREENGEIVEDYRREIDALAIISRPWGDAPEGHSLTAAGKVWIKPLSRDAQDLIESRLPHRIEGMTMPSDGLAVAKFTDKMNTMLITAAQEVGRDIKNGSITFDEDAQRFTGISNTACEPTTLRCIPSGEYRVGRTWDVPTTEDPNRTVKVIHAWFIPEERSVGTAQSSRPLMKTKLC